MHLMYELTRRAFRISPILKVYFLLTILSAGVSPLINTQLIRVLTVYFTEEGAKLSGDTGSFSDS